MKPIEKQGDYSAFTDEYRGREYELRISRSALYSGMSANTAQGLAHLHIAEKCAGRAPKAVTVLADGSARTDHV